MRFFFLARERPVGAPGNANLRIGGEEADLEIGVPRKPCETHVICSILVLDSYQLYERYTTMTRLNVSKAREEFPEVVNRAAYGKERIIVSRRGKDLAAVIPIEDLRLLERLAEEEMDRIDLEAAHAALAEPGENISLRDLMQELGD